MFRCRGIIQSNPNRQDIEKLMILQSRIESVRRRDGPPPKDIHDLEYSVFSQFGDDGIIEYIARNIPGEFHTFVEFGVENYVESNTRLLLQRDNWRGLVIDGSSEHINFIRNAPYFWKHDLSVVNAFITCENINELLVASKFHGTIGILSIDLDGMDYWIWKAIDVIQPLVVIVEFNSLFGSSQPVSVPYRADFTRSKAHVSNLYFGASLPAFVYLAKLREFRFLGCNSAGNNAFFVHPSINVELPEVSALRGYIKSKFREGRGLDGELLYKSAFEAGSAIASLPLVNVVTQAIVQVADLLG